MAIEPTYGMYKTCADINDVEYRPVSLDENFHMNADSLLRACDSNTKAIWICTPNNPSGNNMDHEEIEKVLARFEGIVIIDEAYSDFSTAKTFRSELDNHPNIIVLNTMSKAWGCAGIRLGMAFACQEIIALFNKVKYPYNVNCLTQEQAMEALDEKMDVVKWVNILLQERSRMIRAFMELPICEHVYPTDANFFLARMADARAIYDYLVGQGIIVRNRSKVHLCQNCLRITIGTKGENNNLLAALRQY